MKKLEELNLLDNFLFQELVCSREYGEEFCRILLETILNRKIGRLKVDVEKTYPGILPENHGIRLDAMVSSDTNEIYDLEPNIYEMENPAKRGRFYHSVIAQRNLKRGDTYQVLPEVYIIFILPYDPFGKDRMMYTMETICREIPELPYPDGQHTIFLYTKGKEISGTALKDMLHYMQETKEENAASNMLKRISEMVADIKRSKEVGDRYMISWELYMEDARKDAERQGLKAGMKQGIEQGIELNYTLKLYPIE